MKLIKINPDHFVIVDDSEIRKGDYCLMFDDYGNLFLGNQPQRYLGEQAGHHLNKGLKKITHSTQSLDNRGYWASGIIPLTLQEVKELIGEVDVDKKARKAIPTPMSGTEYIDEIKGFIKGYNQALEDNKDKKYTEKDLIIIFGLGAANRANGKPSLQEAIQTLQPKTEWNVTFNEQNKLTINMIPTKQTVYLPVKESKNLIVEGIVRGEFSHVSDVESEQGYFFTPEQLNEYTQNVIKQALETAAKKVKIKEVGGWNTDGTMYITRKELDKKSITNTFEETYKKLKV